ncbi:MAG: hypothetical protein QM773_01515 [Hyphomonadaceae bacterium]
MCRTFPTCETVDVVMQRVAGELGSAANDLAALESDVASLIGGANVEGMLRLQALDRIGQQLRVLEAFMSAAAPCQCGRIDIEPALDRVWLEAVRKRLGGGTLAAAVAEPELW